MSANYPTDVPFPEPFIPGIMPAGKASALTDPFGNLDQAGAGVTLPPTGGGSGLDLTQLAVRRATTGAIIVPGTVTLTIAGKDICWVQYQGVINGANSNHLKLASLPYQTAL